MTAPLTMDLIVPFMRATEDCFRDILSLVVRPVAIAIQPDHIQAQAVSGMVGLAGARRGICTVHMPVTLADTLTHILYPALEQSIVERQPRSDAVSRVLSEIVARVSAQFVDTPHCFMPTLPGITQGGEPVIFYPPDTQCVVIDFTAGEARFSMEIRLAAV